MAKKGKAARAAKAAKPPKAERAEAKRQKRIADLEEQLDTARELSTAVGALVAAIEEELLAARAALPLELAPEPAPVPLAPRRAPRRPKPGPTSDA